MNFMRRLAGIALLTGLISILWALFGAAGMAKLGLALLVLGAAFAFIFLVVLALDLIIC